MQSKTITSPNFKNLGNNQNYIRSGKGIYKKYSSSYRKVGLSLMYVGICMLLLSIIIASSLNIILLDVIGIYGIIFIIAPIPLSIIPFSLYKKGKYIFNDYRKTSIIVLKDGEAYKKINMEELEIEHNRFSMVLFLYYMTFILPILGIIFSDNIAMAFIFGLIIFVGIDSLVKTITRNTFISKSGNKIILQK